MVEERGALAEAAAARRAAERLLVVDLLVSGERLPAVEGLLADVADKRPVFRVGDAVLDEVTPLLKPLPTLATAEYPLRARGVTVGLPALALRRQAVAAEMPPQAGEVGEGFATFAAVVQGLWFRAARRTATVAVLGFGQLLVAVGYEHRGGGGGGGRRGGHGGGRLLGGRGEEGRVRRLASDATHPDAPGRSSHEARRGALAVPTRAAVVAVAAAAAAMAVTLAAALRFPLRQVARHRLLSPAPSAGGGRRRAVARLGVVFREGQVQRQREGKAGLLLH